MFNPNGERAVLRAKASCLLELARKSRFFDSAETRMPLFDAIGPRRVSRQRRVIITVDAAEDYHFKHTGSLKLAGTDMITAATSTSMDEVVGAICTPLALDMPVAVSFTFTVDGPFR